MPPPPGTGNSESTPTQAQLEAERAKLLEQSQRLAKLTGRASPRMDAQQPEITVLRQVAYDAISALTRAEYVLDIAIDVIRENTDQRLLQNKIASRALKLETEKVRQAEDGERRVDKVLDAALELTKKVVTDSRVWTAVVTTVGWFVLRILTGDLSLPLPAP